MIAAVSVIDVAADEWFVGEAARSRTVGDVDAEQLATRAGEALAAGDDSEALSLANEALEAQHSNARAWRVVSYCLGSMGRHFDAVESALAAVRYEPDEPINYYTHAWALHGAKKPNEALAVIDEALELNPDLAEALSLRAVLRRELGDHKGAIADMRKAKALNGRHR